MIEPSYLSKLMEISSEIIRHISDWVWETDEFGNFTYYKKHSKIFHGYTFIQFLEKNLFEIVPRKYLTNKEPIIDFKTKFSDVNGYLVYYNINAIPFYDEDKNFKGYRGITKLINIVNVNETQLLKNIEILPLIHENLRDLIIVLDQKLKIEYVNQTSFFKALGYSEDSVLNKKFLKFNHPDERKEFKIFLKNLNDKKDDSIDIRLNHKDGFWHWFEVFGKIFKSYSGKLKILLTLRDITERKLAEKKVKEAAHLFKIIMNHTQDLILIREGDSIITDYLNDDVLKDLFGFTKEQISEYVNLKCSYIIEGIKNQEVTVQFKDGTFKTFEIKGKTFNDTDGKNKQLIISRDITEHKISEDRLIKSEKKFRNLFERSPNAILIMNSNGEIIECNRSSEFLSGFSRSDLLYKNFLQVSGLPKQYIPEVTEDFKRLFEGENPERDIQLYTKDGEMKWVHYHGSLIKLGEDNFIQVIIQDIDDRKQTEIKLQESEEKFRSIAERSWVGICIFQDYDIKYINQRAVELIGFTQNEVKNWKVKDFLKIIHPDDIKPFIMAISKRKAGENNNYLHFQYRIITKSGRTRWFKSISKTIPFMGKVADLFITMDITDTKKGEENLKKFNKLLENEIEKRTNELKKSKELLQRKSDEQALLLDNTNTQIWYLKSEDTYGAINKAHAEFIGIDQQDIENKKISNFRIKEEYEKCIEGNHIVFTEKIKIKTEEWVTSKEGDQRLFSVTKTPKLDENGEVEYVICTSEDITDRNLVQMKLKESEIRFRTIAEQALMGIAIIQNGVIKYANNALSLLIEYSIDEIRQWKRFEMKKIFHPDDFLFIMNNLVEITRAQETGINEEPYTAQVSFKIITKSNKIRWLDVYFKDMIYQEHPALLAMTVDITDKKKFEESLIESERKLREQNIELKKLDKLKSDFITIAAHELKTPLISIIGYLDLVITRDNDLKVETLNDLSRSLRNASRLERYIEQLMDVMKIDAKKIELNLKIENICEIIENCISELNFQLHEKNIKVEVLIDKYLPLNIDAFRISQVFSNLFSNAIKFSKNGGQIHISTDKRQNFQIFKIKDFGIGLTDSEIHQLFGKFVMIDQDIENFSNLEKGSGLGLYITKGIIEAHGGKIWVESRGKNRGAEFYFTLPI
ncbi:MAG: PAS domain S-box protein [Promethearchaeota archaeon]